MDHAIVRWEPHPTPGYFLDPRPYLEILPDIVDELPSGARSFAEDPLHDDFSSARCVEDLRLVSLEADDVTGRVILRFTANPWKHESGLDLVYTGVRRMSVDLGIDNQIAGMGIVQLDEVLPDENGVSHEIQLIEGVVKIYASDLTALWGDTGQPPC